MFTLRLTIESFAGKAAAPDLKCATEWIDHLFQTEVSVRDSEDRVALHYAAETMDLEMFQKILEQDPSLLDCEDKNG